LTVIHLNNNNFLLQNLNCFRNFVNLKSLAIGNDDKEKIEKGIYNRFCGSLETLKNLKYLECLDIEGTDIDSGLENLPVQYLKEFSCTKVREEARVESIKNTLDLSEEEAKSAEEEISKYKINKIKNFQLYYLWSRYLNKSKLLSLKIRILREKLEDKDSLIFLQNLLIIHKKAITWGNTREVSEDLRRIKQNLIKELTPQEINELCQAQTQLIEVRTLFSQRRQQLEARVQVNRLPFLIFARR
jgi:hypothetical protein